MDVEQERQKTYYDCSRYEPSYKIGQEMLIFNATVKRAEQEKLHFSIEDHTQFLKL